MKVHAATHASASENCKCCPALAGAEEENGENAPAREAEGETMPAARSGANSCGCSVPTESCCDKKGLDWGMCIERRDELRPGEAILSSSCKRDRPALLARHGTPDAPIPLGECTPEPSDSSEPRSGNGERDALMERCAVAPGELFWATLAMGDKSVGRKPPAELGPLASGDLADGPWNGVLEALMERLCCA